MHMVSFWGKKKGKETAEGLKSLGDKSWTIEKKTWRQLRTFRGVVKKREGPRCSNKRVEK